MKYKISEKLANPNAHQNKVSWDKIKNIKDDYSIEDFAQLVGIHKPTLALNTGDSYANTVAFIVYCIKNKWIVRATS